MTIEKKISEMIGEGLQPNQATKGASAQEPSNIAGLTDGVTKVEGDEPNNKRNNVENQEDAENATTKKPNVATKNATAPEPSNIAGMKEDVDSLIAGEELSEEFKEKAATIFEAAVVNRVKTEVARLQEEFDAKLNESVAQSIEGIVEKVDGYLDYVVEQWMTRNELALESGLKSDILEGFVSGLKQLFESNYIDVPEEKLDLIGSLEEQVAELESKLDESVQANAKMTKIIEDVERKEIIAQLSEGMTDTEVEKFNNLTSELVFENLEVFEKKVKTIKEHYFSGKTVITEGKSVVTDSPVDTLTEETKLDPKMAAYASLLTNKF